MSGALAKAKARLAKLAAPKRGRLARAAKGAVARAAKGAVKGSGEVRGPSPNPATNLVLADIVLRGGGQVLKNTVERALLGAKYSAGKAEKIVEGRSWAQTLIGTALARVATRSVPGALLVGGALVAKTLYDRRENQRAEAAGGDAELDAQARRG